jgi:hypothetical protein
MVTGTATWITTSPSSGTGSEFVGVTVPSTTGRGGATLPLRTGRVYISSPTTAQNVYCTVTQEFYGSGTGGGGGGNVPEFEPNNSKNN